MVRKPFSDPPKSHVITPEGEQRLRKELDHLWKVERPEVTRSVSEAAAMGDRSENAEYIYGKKRLREIDRRVRFLRKRLEVLKVVSKPPDDRSKIYFGAWVNLEDEEGNELRYRLVGPDEFDLKQGLVSVDAPLGRALLRKQVEDEVCIQLPDGSNKSFYVLAIEYR